MYEFDEKRFWKYYVAMEQEKCVQINSFRSIPSLLSNYAFQTFQSSSKNGDISLWEDVNDNKHSAYAYDKFWLFFLTESAKFSMFWLLLNSVFPTVAFFLLLKELLTSNNDVIGEDFNFADAIALLLQLALWISVSVGGGLFFALLHNFSPKAIETIFSCDPVIVWVRIGRMILSLITIEIFARLSLIDFNMTNHSFGDSSKTQSTLYSFRNGLQVLVDMTQMMVLYLLPFPPKFFIAISTVLMVEQILRLQIRNIHLQDANVVWMYSMARITVIVLWIVMVLYSNVFESSARESYSFSQRRIKEAAERRGFLKLLCSDIKVPLQYILLSLDNLSNDAVMHVVFQAPDSEAGRSISPSGLVLMKEIQWLRKAILCDTTLVNWLVDDLLLVMRMKEDRFTFKCRYRVNIRSHFREVAQSIDKLLPFHGHDGDNASVVTLSTAIEFDKIPDIFVHTSQQCMYVLVRCFLMLLWRLHQQHKKVLPSQEGEIFHRNVAPFLDISLIAHKMPFSQQDSQHLRIIPTHILQVTLNWDCSVDLDPGNGSDKLFSSDTAQFFCNYVAKSCFGRAAFNPGLYSCSIGCIREPSNTVDSHEMNRYPNDMSFRDLQSSPTHRLEPQQRLRTDFTTCLLVEDTIFVGMIRSVLEKINHGDASPAFNNLEEIPVETLKKFDLLFLSSISRCKLLRDGGYKGLIVLFSGELSYLDEHSQSLFDYKLPFPILEDSVARFSDWFLQQKMDHIRSRADGVLRTSVNAPNSSIKIKRHHIAKALESKKKFFLFQNFLVRLITEFLHMSKSKFQGNSVETYFKWRLINPSESITFHNSQLTYYFCILAISRLIWILFFGTAPSPNRMEILGVVRLILIALMDKNYKYILIPFKIKFSIFLAVVSVIIVFGFQFFVYQPTLQDCRVLKYVKYIPPGRSLNETLLACDSDGYRMMRFILSGDIMLSRWCTWACPR